MRNERGAASLVGILLTMVILAFGAWFLLKNTGMLGGGGEGEESEIDQATVAAVQIELGQVKRGLEMVRTLSPERAYPATAAINSLHDLRRAMPATMVLADSASLHFDFSSYASAASDRYLLRVKVRNRAGDESGWGLGAAKPDIRLSPIRRAGCFRCFHSPSGARTGDRRPCPDPGACAPSAGADPRRWCRPRG